VFGKILQNTWLEEKTKNYALKKLDNLQFIYDSDINNTIEDPDIEYNNILYENMSKVMEWRHKKFVELEGNSIINIPMLDWNQYPVVISSAMSYVVNSFYVPTKNAIYINLGHIQPPFIDLKEKGIEYNISRIGIIIAHELSHGFDDLGSKYGWDGNIYNWWTEKDKKKFKLLQEDIITQYEEFAARDGIKLDASISLGENMADLSALSMCARYLQEYLANYGMSIPIKRLAFTLFYTQYAIQLKQKISQTSINALLKINPHPPNVYRCNIPLSRAQIFRALYNIKKGDGMWWHNTINVW